MTYFDHPSSTRSGITRRGLISGGVSLGASLALAGCTSGGGATGSGGGSGYEPGSAALKVELGPEIEDKILYPEPWRGAKAREVEKFGDGTTEFRVVTRQQTGVDMDTNTFSTWMEENTGVKVKYETVPMGDEGAPKVNAMIASGDLPDAFQLGPTWMGGFSRTEAYVYGQQGLFQGLSKLIDEYAPELLNIFEHYPDLRSYMTAPDGEIYTFPQINDCFHCHSQQTRTWINSTWLEKVGLEIPKTTDELRTVLQAFKDENPSGLDRSVPASGIKDQPMMLGYFLQSFLYTPNERIARDGDKLVFTPAEDAFRDGLRFVAGLVRDGLLDRTAFTQSREQIVRRTMNKEGSLVGMAFGNQPGTFTELNWEDPNARFREYVHLPPVTGPSGKAFVPWVYTPPGLPVFVITSACQDPVAMMRWIDTQLGLIPSISVIHGELGKGFTWAKEGEMGLDSRQGVHTVHSIDAKNVGWGQVGARGATADVRAGSTQQGDTIESLLYNAGKEAEEFAVPLEKFFDEPTYSAEQAAEIGELTTNLNTHMTQATTRFCLGQDDIEDDAAWEGYKSKLNDLGVERFLQINQEADAAG